MTALKALLWPRRGERLIPAVSAVLLALSFPPLHLLVPPFIGLAPFALWVHGMPPDAEGRRAAVRGSMLFGAIYFGIVFYWILVALIWFTSLAILAFLAALVGLIAIAALFGWILHRAVHVVRAPLWLALPVAWTAAEWARAHLPSTIAFPWLGLGTSLTAYPELVGIAELVGARGVTFWLALVNGLVAVLVLRLRARRSWALPGAVIAVVVVAPMAWGVWRAQTLEIRDAATVAVMQPNIPEHIKLDTRAGLDSTFASLTRLVPRIAPRAVDLVVMPEVVLRIFPKAEIHETWLDPLYAWSRYARAPILFGALGYRGDLGGVFTPYNSAFMIDSGGLADYEYDKRFLVPFVERVPLLPPEWFGSLQYFGGFGVGEGWPLARVNGTAYGVLICYESSYPEASRRFRLEGADVLLNITNDAWYGREPLYARTTALWQHPAHMVMRAIENRMGVARSANTGISLFVDPVGRVYGPTELFTPAVRSEVVRTTDVVTFYTRFGDLAGNGSAMAAVVLVLASVGLSRGAGLRSGSRSR
ncbi:MAG TPA: apolipoprotein N-acyltransferase [Longimicrobiales bacterium]|nr:apolipoprotein N-acyltransferase [Longimicrobiales bacterium]